MDNLNSTGHFPPLFPINECMPQCEHKIPNFLFLHSDSLLTWLSQNENVIKMSGNVLLKNKILLHNTTQLHVSEGCSCDRRVSVTKVCHLLWKGSAVCPLWLFCSIPSPGTLTVPGFFPFPAHHCQIDRSPWYRIRHGTPLLSKRHNQVIQTLLQGLLVSKTWLHSTCLLLIL